MPVIVAFCGLLIYGLTSAWRDRHSPLVTLPSPLSPLLSSLCLGGLLARIAWLGGGNRLRDGACPPADGNQGLDAGGLDDPPRRSDKPAGRGAGGARGRL